MFSRLKSAVTSAVETLDPPRGVLPRGLNNQQLPHKHNYTRPAFLNLSEDALVMSKDKKVRPVLSASSSQALPHCIGYAECINAGKSNLNEDMAQIHHSTLRCRITESEEAVLSYAYYGIFDGHAGFGAALDASKQLHHIIHQKLVDSMDHLFAMLKDPSPNKLIDKKLLIIGCLETAFCEMDELVKSSRTAYYNPGGCTAIVALFIMGDLYVANAGDCRACITSDSKLTPMSNDFSPYYDKTRIYRHAYDNPSLLGDKYTTREFFEFPTRDDLGKNVLYRDPFMTGWAYKTLTPEDLKLPLITGLGRRSRIMGTIGVARGFGDFDLTANHYKTPIKPFLSCVPEVKVHSIEDMVDESAVLIIASDGLWDAVDADDVVQIWADSNSQNNPNSNVTIAMNLVAAARGRKDYTTNLWVLKNTNVASLDDISVFVIPFKPFMKSDAMQYNIVNIMASKEKCSTSPVEVSDTESGSTPPSSPVGEPSRFPECDLNEHGNFENTAIETHSLQ